MLSPSSPSQDTPPVLAILGLLAVVGLFLFLQAPTTALHLFRQVDQEFASEGILLWCSLGVFAGNLMTGYSVIASSMGLTQQGSRLAILTGRKSQTTRTTLSAISVSFLAAFVSFWLMTWIGFPSVHRFSALVINARTIEILQVAIRLNFAISLSLIVWLWGRLPSWKRWLARRKRELPVLPEPENGIVLGSIGDDSAQERPEWVVSGRKALNGNILVTGSIGGGKTQGTILPYLDQILGNFSPRPSILAIDPKGTFIPEAMKIIAKHGLEAHVLHLRLGGNVTFNPIYSPRSLKEARFLDTAQMIRAAAVNFMGKSFDSPFWEISAFNLIKNCLVLCAAKYVKRDFGLTHLYQEMVMASKDSSDTAKYLRALSKGEDFDDEERFNIDCAAQYFDEFGQLDDKVKTGILATSTAFLNQFQEYQASQIFCPSYGEATLKSMDEVVDEGKILLFDISSPALARSMGTFIKLHFQQSVLDRLKGKGRNTERTAVLIADEYQDVVSTGAGMTIGDDRYCAKNREANGIAIFATQSLTSLKNSIGKDDAAKELFQNFRTVISAQSTDLATIKNFQELAGQHETERVSHSLSENSQRPSRNLITGGFDASEANISESFSTSEQKEYIVTGKEFSRLQVFESFALIYDGIRTEFRKLFLKPYFLKKKNVLQREVIGSLAALLLVIAGVPSIPQAHAFPNVCTVVKSLDFRSCLGFSVGGCMCGFPPRPCASFSYYVPQTFIEVFPERNESYFGDLPGAAVQLKGSLGAIIPYGAEADDDTQSFQSHVLGVPFSSLAFSSLPCGGGAPETSCFGGMSEDVEPSWSTGSADLLQPNYLAWSLSPKACLLKGALQSGSGGGEVSFGGGYSCSVPLGKLTRFPPSTHSACNGWGTFYPRSGTVAGLAQTTGALMVASRMKSLGTDVFHSTPASLDEIWQMISPQSSSCFREGQNVATLDGAKNVRELGDSVQGG